MANAALKELMNNAEEIGKNIVHTGKKLLVGGLIVATALTAGCKKDPINQNNGNTGTGTETGTGTGTGNVGTTNGDKTILYTYDVGSENVDKGMNLTDVQFNTIGKTSYIARSYTTTGVNVTTRWVNYAGGTVTKVNKSSVIVKFPNYATGTATEDDAKTKVYQETVITAADGKKTILQNFVKGDMTVGFDADLTSDFTLDKFIALSTSKPDKTINLLSPEANTLK